MAQPTRNHRSYTIGIVCALAIEKAAVEAMLDEEYPRLAIVKGDDNDYTFSRTGLYNVVVSCLPMGLTGKASGATVAQDMLRSFPIKIGLLVGIG